MQQKKIVTLAGAVLVLVAFFAPLVGSPVMEGVVSNIVSSGLVSPGLGAAAEADAQEGSNAAATPGIPTESYPDYPAVGKDTGVWNDGQSALWDLAILDHYNVFGPTQRAKGHRPEQPINFSHIVHVQKNKMECQYCHWNVTKSPYALIPDEQSCMGCHKFVKGQDPASQAEIKKLEDYYARGEAIPWKKVHVIPNHVKFNHKRHVKAGVNCQSCHGQVGEMPEVERVATMKMGWCIDCHRQKGASIDCATCHH
jgi:hypothetical protein